MPLLAPGDPLPVSPRRVLTAGTSGSGKTTLAARIGELLDLPHVEIDALYHGEGWVPRDSFMAEVEEFSAQPRWVTEWQYGSARPLLADRADLVVWLDLPHRVTMRQVVARTWRRRRAREVLWNGNVEPGFRTLLTRRDHVVRWAWSTRHKTLARVEALRTSHPDLPVVRLRSHGEAAAWLAGPLAATR